MKHLKIANKNFIKERREYKILLTLFFLLKSGVVFFSFAIKKK